LKEGPLTMVEQDTEVSCFMINLITLMKLIG